MVEFSDTKGKYIKAQSKKTGADRKRDLKLVMALLS